MIAIPFVIDVLVQKRIKSFSSTFVFPASYVVNEYLYSLNPFDKTGILGYTQYQFTTYHNLLQ